MIDGYKAQIADLDVLAQSIFVDTFGNVAVNDKCWDIIQMGATWQLQKWAKL